MKGEGADRQKGDYVPPPRGALTKSRCMIIHSRARIVRETRRCWLREHDDREGAKPAPGQGCFHGASWFPPLLNLWAGSAH